MLRNKFQREIESLKTKLVRMGALVESAIDDSAKALITQNKELCQKVIDTEKDIDALRVEIESKSLKILLMQQPVAGDLRAISTALKLIAEMERIGDQARDICDILLELCEEDYQQALVILPQMAELARVMVRESVDAFVKESVELAEKVIKIDDEMDDLFNKLKVKMVKNLKEKPKYADQMIYFLMLGKYFEKIGDHAENIAQWVIFAKTGEHKNIKLF